MTLSPHKWGVFERRFNRHGQTGVRWVLIFRHKSEIAAKARCRGFDQKVRRLTKEERA